MSGLIGALIGAGAGALKNQEDRRGYIQEQEMNVNKARYSPWTGARPTNPQNPSLMGAVLQGMMAGMLMGNQMGNKKKPDGGEVYSDNNQQRVWAANDRRMSAPPLNGYQNNSNKTIGNMYA